MVNDMVEEGESVTLPQLQQGVYRSVLLLRSAPYHAAVVESK